MTMGMPHVPLASGALQLSRIVLGGHEYLADGRSRAFNEDLQLAVTPGHVFAGFGGPLRQSVLAEAYRLGITSFDVTMDSEKEALGRNLRALPPPRSVLVQTRPEGMVYGYDRGNRRMVEPGALRAEVLRILSLLQRDALDILNLGILKDAIAADSSFPTRLAAEVRALKSDGLIRAAAADTFSGEATYLALLEQGVFDTINLNFNLADDAALTSLIPRAQAIGVRVVVREIFIKGALFNIARDAGIADAPTVARVAMQWAAVQPGIDALIVGAATPKQLRASVDAAAAPEMSPDDRRVLDALRATPALVALRERNRQAFNISIL